MTAYSSFSEFDDHTRIIDLKKIDNELDGFIALHRNMPHIPSFGATRLWHYSSRDDALKDALKLSKAMSYKCAMAGLKYGGGKAVIRANNVTEKNRRLVLLKYAQYINELGGQFITGTDMGLTQDDLLIMKKNSNHFVGIYVDPAYYTGLGLFSSLKVCLQEVFGDNSLTKRSFAIEGIGKIGIEFLKHIHNEAKEIYVTDTDPVKFPILREKFPKIKFVDARYIHSLKVDVFSPCASSNALNGARINSMHCGVIVGGANNQLENQEIGAKLHKKGILYAPDYIVNAGGLISVIMEFENSGCTPNHEKIEKRVNSIGLTLSEILLESKRAKLPPHCISDRMACNLIAQKSDIVVQ